jgi:hypothetical protein
VQNRARRCQPSNALRLIDFVIDGLLRSIDLGVWQPTGLRPGLTKAGVKGAALKTAALHSNLGAWPLLYNFEAEFFDDWIGQDVFG